MRDISLDVSKIIDGIQTVVHPLIPEKWRLCQDNKNNIIKQPISICCGNLSQIFILDNSSKCVFSCRLHYPVEVT